MARARNQLKASILFSQDGTTGEASAALQAPCPCLQAGPPVGWRASTPARACCMATLLFPP